jgi:uncharacterized phage protein (TIGR01671 family)
MREIKFRGKSVNTGKWIYGSLVDNLFKTKQDEKVSHIVNIETPVVGWESITAQITCFEEVYTKSVGQFTGFQDFYSRDIYIGDILKGYTYKEPIALKTKREIIGVCEREWNNGFGFYADLPNGYRTYPNLKECIIIGNIYENPELIEASK